MEKKNIIELLSKYFTFPDMFEFHLSRNIETGQLELAVVQVSMKCETIKYLTVDKTDYHPFFKEVDKYDFKSKPKSLIALFDCKNEFELHEKTELAKSLSF